MNAETIDNESNDSDIFIIKQIKPINKLTLQQALIIKHGVLSINKVGSYSKSNNSKKNKRNKSSSEEKAKKSKKIKLTGTQPKVQNSKQKPSSNNNSKTVDCESNKLHVKKTTPKKTQIQNIKSPVKQLEPTSGIAITPEKIDSSESRKSEEKNIQLSPGIKKRFNKYHLPKEISCNSNKNENKKVVKKIFPESDNNKLQKKNTLDYKREDSTNCSFNASLEYENNQKFSTENETLENNHELLCFLTKKIIHDETQKQIELEKYILEEGEVPEKLLTKTDCKILEKFLNLKDSACYIFVRMLCRKKSWHRVSAINYKNISDNLEVEFNLLHEIGFLDVNIEDEDLQTQMAFLSKPELVQLYKIFSVKYKSNNSSKNDLINYLIQNFKNQRSVMNMFNKKENASRLELLKFEIKKILGFCIRLNKAVVTTFHRIFLLFSFAHYFEEEDKRFSNQLYLYLNVFRNILRFPKYNLSPTLIFKTLEDFLMYEEALWLYNSFETALTEKSFENFVDVGRKASEKFKALLMNSEYQKRFMQLPSFLKKFSAGSVYARILTIYCEKFKKKSDTKEIISIVEMLLEQNLFLNKKKGKWYNILSHAYEDLKKNNKAAEIIIKSLKEPYIDEVQRLTLQLRGQALLKRKSNCVDNIDIREELDDLCTISVQEPSSIEIRGRALQGNESGYKCVYIEENENGKMFTSVEEKAILHYKSIGFTKGYHTEGHIIQSIYFLLFFDIIYGLSPPGTFQSAYQNFPLDFFSESFYLNRKESIDSLLSEMCDWKDDVVKQKLKSVYNDNFNVSCVISWNNHFTPEFFYEIVKCITMPILVLIFRRFVKNFRVARSGFPDLTLWNPQTQKCKFVEVKSPNDKLSPAQRIWLNYLRNVGLDCEVCNVKNVSGKKFSVEY